MFSIVNFWDTTKLNKKVWTFKIDGRSFSNKQISFNLINSEQYNGLIIILACNLLNIEFFEIMNNILITSAGQRVS